MDATHPPEDSARVDRGWWGYSPRAAVPQLAIAATASLVLLIGRWYLAPVSDFAAWAGALAVYGLALAVWPSLLGAVVYRAITFTYRLTDHALLMDWGPLYRPEPPVQWNEIVEVGAVRTRLGRWLGVGWVRVATTAGRTVWLKGVRRPERMVQLVEKIRG